MNLVERAQNILLQPAAEWLVIEKEAGDIKSIYIQYLIVLAAIPAVAGFLGNVIFGVSIFGVPFRPPLLQSLATMVSSYVLTLLMFYAMAFVIDALAPTFDSQKGLLPAFKLVAYSSTAALLAGIFALASDLSILAIGGAFYSLYLVYLGLPILMKCPPEKALPYTLTVVVLSVLAGVILGIASQLFTPSPPRSAAVGVRAPNGNVTLDAAAIEAMTRQMDAANERVEAARKTGDTAAASKAAAEAMGNVGAMMGAITGTAGATGKREHIPLDDLKAVMPEAVGAFTRESFGHSRRYAMGVKSFTVKGSFRSGDATMQIEVVDVGDLGGPAAMAAMVSAEGESQDANGTERTYKDGKRFVKERTSKTAKSASYTVVLPNGVSVEASGTGVDLATVKGAVTGLDLAKLEAHAPK